MTPEEYIEDEKTPLGLEGLQPENGIEAFGRVINAQLNPDRSVNIAVSFDNDVVVLGDTAHFTAELNGYEGWTTNLQWQESGDGNTWTDIEGVTATNYDMDITEENMNLSWRVKVIITGYETK